MAQCKVSTDAAGKKKRRDVKAEAKHESDQAMPNTLLKAKDKSDTKVDIKNLKTRYSTRSKDISSMQREETKKDPAKKEEVKALLDTNTASSAIVSGNKTSERD